ncbi:MAG: RNA polymerase sigma factor, partial [Thermoanaerobaculia bacterium]|nr:RNA polymerase sigma factor [Thermoanaerobaculia bacterium]
FVRRALANDRDAAEELVDRTYAAVYASLLKLSGDPDLAADLTQETFRKAWRSLSSFRGKSRVFTWLYRIAYTTFLNVKRRPRVVTTMADDALPDPVDPQPGQDEAVIEEIESEALRRSVLHLDEKQRFVVTAHYWGDLSLPEIASSEGVSAVAIRKRLAKALEQLEELLRNSP